MSIRGTSSPPNPQSAFSEWYLNRQEGLEQGFTLAASPGTRVTGERLRLSMKLQGDLCAKTSGSGQSVELLRANGEHVLRYEHLVVKDAKGTQLEATMGASAERMWLEVDDSNAVYPVTIDPAFVQTLIKVFK